MSNGTYNGWTNYETWVVKLWMDNDEGSYHYWQAQTSECYEEAAHQYPNRFMSRDENAQSLLAERLKEHHEELAAQSPEHPAGVLKDLQNAALSEVNWHEIATALLEEREDA